MVNLQQIVSLNGSASKNLIISIGYGSEAVLLADFSSGKDRIQEMVAAYLESIGRRYPEVIIETGQLRLCAVKRCALPRANVCRDQILRFPVQRLETKACCSVLAV
jgi:hypothetical protein